MNNQVNATLIKIRRDLVSEGKQAIEPSEVTSRLKRMRTKTGGTTYQVDYDDGQFKSWYVEPNHRQRLDHFGNDGEGWDEEGWNESYAEPVWDEANAWLDKEFGRGLFKVGDVGEKGYIKIVATPKGVKWMRGG